MLALGNVIGVTVAAGLLTWACWRVGILTGIGTFSLDCGRATAAAALGALAGWAITTAIGPAGVLGSLLIAAASGLAAVLITTGLLAVVDPALVAAGRGALARRGAP